MAKKTLQGFGSPSSMKFGGAGMKQLGTIGGKKDIRPVGGNLTGTVKSATAPTGEPKMSTLGGKSVCCTSKGQGPKVTLPDNNGMKTSDLGSGKKLGGKDVREMP